MSKCRRCGQESFGRRVCDKCLKRWSDRRTAAYEQALAENGGVLTDSNLSAVQKRTKQLEKDWEGRAKE